MDYITIKYYVLKKLLSLNHVAKQQDVTRDILVEVYINQLLPVIETELNKHKKRKTLLKEMKTYQDQGKKLLRVAEELLGEDDMLCEKIKNQISITNKNVAAAEKIIKKGMPMEDW